MLQKLLTIHQGGRRGEILLSDIWSTLNDQRYLKKCLRNYFENLSKISTKFSFSQTFKFSFSPWPPKFLMYIINNFVLSIRHCVQSPNCTAAAFISNLEGEPNECLISNVVGNIVECDRNPVSSSNKSGTQLLTCFSCAGGIGENIESAPVTQQTPKKS